MKATLYEALGIPPAASDEEVRGFINHASRILSDPEMRQRYDKELTVTSEATTEERIAHFVSNVAAEVGTGTATQAGDEVIDIAEEKILTGEAGSAEKSLHHPGLTERVMATFGRTLA